MTPSERITRLEDVLNRLLDAASHAIDDWCAMADDCDQNAEPVAAADYRQYAQDAEDALDEARALLRGEVR